MMPRSLVIAVLILGALIVAPAWASVIYNSGTLGFESTEQSMWGSGDAFRKSESVFVGTQWNDKTARIGGITGNEREVVIPGTNPVYTSIWEPRIWVPTPSWSDPFAGYRIGCGCTKNVQIWPGTPAVTADTRTGATINLHTSGKAGLDFGYTIDSGSIDATADFGATATLPDTVSANQFFRIDTDSHFTNGTIKTQSPEVEAYFSAIMQLSGSIDAKACALTFGCTSGNEQLPNINLNQRVLSIDPGSLKILEGVLPDGAPLAETPIANRSLTLEGGITPVPPYVGIKLTDSSGLSLADTMPDPAPEITVNLVEIGLNIPNIATSGTSSDDKITSSGRDDLLSAQWDIDGIATIFAGLPPAGLNLNLIDAGPFVLTVSLDLIDVDAGPVLGIRQDFELVPTLMVDLDFSNPIQIAGMTDLQSNWTGRWGDLPEFAISHETTFTPTFWLDAILQNDTGLDLGLTGTMDLLKLGATASVGGINLLHFNPFNLNQLLGLDNTLFETDKLSFSVFDESFGISGFNSIRGPSFTLGINQTPVIIPPPDDNLPTTTVPEPGSAWLLLAGFCVLIGCSNPRLRKYS